MANVTIACLLVESGFSDEQCGTGASYVIISDKLLLFCCKMCDIYIFLFLENIHF